MREFILNIQNAEAWRRLALEGKRVPDVGQFTTWTLPGAMELFSTGLAFCEQTNLFDEIRGAAEAHHPLWGPLCAEWECQRHNAATGSEFATPSLEFFRLRHREDQTGAPLSFFQERFRRSIESKGFPKPFANAIASVLGEMTDNVVQHSGESEEGFTGLAAYHAGDNHFSFSVVDVGHGILASLKNSDAWKNLTCSRDALRAVVSKHASSRVGQGDGEGFKDLFASMADRNAVIRLRTGDCSLTISNGKNEREGGELSSPGLAGLQVSVFCNFKERAAETVI